MNYTEKFIQEAASYGYTVSAIQPTSYSTNLKVYFDDDHTGRYSTSIYEEPTFGEETEKPTYSIQTTSYGSLPLDEIELLIANLQRAREMALLLQNVDYDQLTPYLHPELAARREKARLERALREQA